MKEIRISSGGVARSHVPSWLELTEDTRVFHRQSSGGSKPQLFGLDGFADRIMVPRNSVTLKPRD